MTHRPTHRPTFHLVHTPSSEPAPARRPCLGEHRRILVHVQFNCVGDWHTRSPQDDQTPGLYEAMVPAELSDALAASCALDGLFCTIAAELVHYRFTVYDAVSGATLSPDPLTAPYALASCCTGVQRVGHLG